MRKLMILLLVCSSVSALAQKANFSGNWKLNKSKTDFGEAPEYVIARYVKVDQATNKIIVSRVFVDEQLNEKPAFSDSLTFDGKAFRRTNSYGTVITSTIKWHSDLSPVVNMNSNVQRTVETWSLEEGGRTLVLDRTVVESGGGRYAIKAYYDKQ